MLHLRPKIIIYAILAVTLRANRYGYLFTFFTGYGQRIYGAGAGDAIFFDGVFNRLWLLDFYLWAYFGCSRAAAGFIIRPDYLYHRCVGMSHRPKCGVAGIRTFIARFRNWIRWRNGAGDDLRQLFRYGFINGNGTVQYGLYFISHVCADFGRINA